MQALLGDHRLGSINRELVALALASVACVATLLAGLTDSGAGAGTGSTGTIPLRLIVLLVIFGGAIALAATVVVSTVTGARRVVSQARDETAELRRKVLMAETLVLAEPQVLVFWEPGEGLRVINHSLESVDGLPWEQAALLRFGQWVEPQSARELKRSLDRLFEAGTSFSLLLKTSAGGLFEAEGRAVGVRAVLRLRDVAGFRAKYGQALEEQKRLQREIDLARALFDGLDIPVWFRDEKSRLAWANKAYVRTVDGGELTEVLDRQLELLEERQRILLRRGLDKGKAFNGEFHLIVDGERRRHNVVAVKCEADSAGAAIDVAALEQALGELDRQSSAFDRTLDRIKTAVAIYDAHQRLTFFNAAFARLWGLDPVWLRSSPSDGEVLDRLSGMMRLPGVVDYKSWKADLHACYADGKPIEDWWHLPNGQMLHVTAERRRDGGVTYLYEDATERLLLESRYNELIDVQRETLDSMKEGVAVFAADGRLKLYNSALAGIWRLSRSMLDTHPHIDEFISNARVIYDSEETWRRFSFAVTAFSDERAAHEGVMTWPDGSVVDYAIMPLPDGATLVTFADVTDTRRYERALVERNDALVAADRLKSQFIGHVSYELRTPLTNIIGFSELLASPRTGPLNQKQREYLNDIRASSTTLLSIIDDILDLATMDAGALDLKVAPTDARHVIEGAVQGVRERAARARLSIRIEAPDEPMAFSGDEARIRQILYNLLSNAIGFSDPNSTVSVKAWREPDWVAFQVSDEGVGVPSDQIGRVFEPFESMARGARSKGAGLGLAIVKSLVELHGGEISFQSADGAGTTVTVRLPSDDKVLRPIDEARKAS
jgi:signal transduction histidine kinase